MDIHQHSLDEALKTLGDILATLHWLGAEVKDDDI
jgi:hypothetical protein